MELPNYHAVGRRGFTGSSRVVSKDTSNADLGLSRLGAGIEAVGGAITERHDKSQDYAASQAQAEFLVAKAKADNDYDNDPDYETISDRYSKQVSDALQAAGGRITDPKRREAFLLENSVSVARGQERMIDLAFGKEAQVRRAEMQSNLQDLSREVALGNVVPGEASLNARTMLEAAQESGYIDPETSASTLASFKAQTTVAGLARLPAADRLTALQQPWTKDLPASEILKLRNTAAIEMRRDASIGMVDEIIATGATTAEARAIIKEIEDKNLRLETESRYDSELRRQRDAEAESLKEFNADIFLPIRQGKARVSDIPVEALELLTPAQVNGLYAAEKAARGSGSEGTSSIKTDRMALTKVISLISEGKSADARDYLLKNAAKFSDGDYEQYLSDVLPPPDAQDESTDLALYGFAQELIAEGRLEEAQKIVFANRDAFSDTDAKSIIRTANPKKAPARTIVGFRDRIESRGLEMGIKGDKNKRLSDEEMLVISDWYQGQISATGSVPTDAEVNAEIDRRLVEVTINPPGWFNKRTLKGDEMTPADYDTAYELIDKPSVNSAIESLEARGAPVTRATVVSEHARLSK